MTSSIRTLLDKNNEFNWSTEHQRDFDKLKDLLSSEAVLRYYDIKKSITVQCDASQHGLGAVLLQDNHPVAYVSRAMTQTEYSYAQIEKELLAIVYAMERFHTYVYGRQVTVHMDHKPLISIFKKSLTAAPRRLRRMLLRLQQYSF